jgi:hypothetical protein
LNLYLGGCIHFICMSNTATTLLQSRVGVAHLPLLIQHLNPILSVMLIILVGVGGTLQPYVNVNGQILQNLLGLQASMLVLEG